MKILLPVWILLGLCFLGLGCGEARRPSEEATPAVPARPDTSDPDLPADTAAAGVDAWTAGIVEGPAPGTGVAVLRSVNAARHEDFDRVVFAFDDGRRPGYHIEYVDRPVRACGSGEVVPLEGDGWLEVRMEPAQAHTDEGEVTVARREERPALPVLKELKLTCDFEGTVTWVLGLAAPNRYRVLELEGPARLVVDVRH